MSKPNKEHSLTSSVAVNTTAPHPSPNKMHVPRSRQSTYLLKTSAPTTSTFLYPPPLMKCIPLTNPTTNPEHAAVKSYANAPFAPIALCNKHADPNKSSGELVATMIKSISSGFTLAIFKAPREASAAKDVNVSSPEITCLFPIPVLVRIHSSLVSTSLARSSLVMNFFGNAFPTPEIFAPLGVNDAVCDV